MRAPGPGQLFGLSRCSGAATQAQSRPHRPRGNRSTAPRFAPGNTCSRGDSEDTRGPCWRRYQMGLDGAGPPPPSAPPPAGGGKRLCKGLRPAAGISLCLEPVATRSTRSRQRIGLTSRVEISAPSSVIRAPTEQAPACAGELDSRTPFRPICTHVPSHPCPGRQHAAPRSVIPALAAGISIRSAGPRCCGVSVDRGAARYPRRSAGMTDLLSGLPRSAGVAERGDAAAASRRGDGLCKGRRNGAMQRSPIG